MAARTVTVRHIAPAAAFKVALAFSLVGLVAWLIAVTVLYFGMEAVGVWDSVNSLVSGVGGEQLVNFGVVFAVSALLGAVGAIAVSILVPLGAVIYNAFHELVGGFEVELVDV